MKVEYINHYLTDIDVAHFARLSFNRLANEFSEAQNHKLIQFLARGMKSDDWEELLDEMINVKNTAHANAMAVYLRSIPEHWVPFGHPHISLHMQAPVPIARQLFKHKIGFTESEESRRYVSYRPTLYIPDTFRAVASDKKQGSEGEHARSSEWKLRYQALCESAIDMYCSAIDDGICPEQARFMLPQGTEVQWALTGSLYAFANMYNQRSDSHAQEEVQDIARQLDEIIAPLFPVSWAALTEGAY